MYEVKLLDSSDKIVFFPAASVPVICQPLVRPVVPEEVIDSFKHLDLADVFFIIVSLSTLKFLLG